MRAFYLVENADSASNYPINYLAMYVESGTTVPLSTYIAR